MYMPRFSVLIGGLLLAAPVTHASNVDVNINLGAPPPVIVREPAPPQRTVIIEDVPEFVYPPALGYYVAVGTPYDLFYLGGTYYLFRNGVWHRGHDYSGPWKVIRGKHVPYGLRKHRLETIRHHRDREHVVYQRDRDRYRGKHFRPDHEWKERQKREHREYKEDRREFKEHRRGERDDYKEHRRQEREEWRDDHKGGHERGGRGRD
jgi:hypothetical protein